MNWSITSSSKTFTLSDRQKDYIQEKIGRLERYLEGIQHIQVVVRNEATRGATELLRVEVTIQAEHGMVVRAEEQNTDVSAAIDSVHDRLQRQITRHKGRNYRRGRPARPAQLAPDHPPGYTEPEATEGGADADDEEQEAHIVRTKSVRLKPMFSEEAIDEMELLGHSFFVFRDAETENISVVYKRRDGNYGLITPQ